MDGDDVMFEGENMRAPRTFVLIETNKMTAKVEIGCKKGKVFEKNIFFVKLQG